ncbi:MAG: caspase family protein [Fimbriimonas sp.]
MKRITMAAALAALFVGVSTAQAETYAVLVGINQYPAVLDKDGKPMKDDKGNVINPNLSGAVNDIKTYNDLLVNKFGVKPANIKALYDKDAGEAGFIGAMKWALETAKPGDQVVFAYSGHGGQIEDKKEEDGLQEVIVLADDKLVPGSLFGDLARNLMQAGISSTLIFDSCFSGGMSRDVFSFDGKPGQARVKYLDVKMTSRMTKVPDAKIGELKAIQKQGLTQSADYAFLFAGAEDQTTTDLDFKDPAKPDRGLFSLVFGGILEELPEAPLEECIDAIKKLLKEKGFKQVPGFEFSSPERGKKPLLKKQ